MEKYAAQGLVAESCELGLCLLTAAYAPDGNLSTCIFASIIPDVHGFPSVHASTVQARWAEVLQPVTDNLCNFQVWQADHSWHRKEGDDLHY